MSHKLSHPINSLLIFNFKVYFCKCTVFSKSLGVLCFSKYLIMCFKVVLSVQFIDYTQIVQINKQFANLFIGGWQFFS